MKGGKAKTETKKADSKLAVKRTTSERASKAPAKKAAKDASKPKRAASAFFVFLEEFRKQYKEQHPENKSVAAVGKAAGAKWKSMSDAEKAPYHNKSNKRKAELQKAAPAPEKKKKDDPSDDVEEEDESDKSKSEVNDEDDESGEVDSRMLLSNSPLLDELVDIKLRVVVHMVCRKKKTRSKQFDISVGW